MSIVVPHADDMSADIFRQHCTLRHYGLLSRTEHADFTAVSHQHHASVQPRTVVPPIQADAMHLPIADNSVDLIVTSPPYFGLRSYANGGIGEEPTPAEYVDALIAATREMVRVLKPSGSIFVNLGDKYANAAPSGNTGKIKGVDNRATYSTISALTAGFKAKSLIGLPWRYAIRCVDELGLILRRDIIWDKPNALPESVTDRCRSSHEYWFHLVTQPRYFAAIDEIRLPYVTARTGMTWEQRKERGDPSRQGEQRGTFGAGMATNNPLGSLPGSVWSIPTEPLRLPPELGVEHYAAFPSEWPRRLILGWSPREVCTACGEGRRPMVDRELRTDVAPAGPKHMIRYSDKTGLGTGYWHTITGCACPDLSAPTTPSIILDPFGGTGTTAAVAQTLGRIGISVDLAYDYARVARWRAEDPKLWAKVMKRTVAA